MTNIDETISRYYNWLDSLIQLDISMQTRLLVYNSLKVCNRFKKYPRDKFEDFINHSKGKLDNIEFEDLKTLPKFHICLYVFLNNDDSEVSIFIRDWIKYLKSNKIENRHDFPFYFWQDYSKLPQFEKGCLEYPKIFDIASIYSHAINIATSFGTRNSNYKLDEKSYYLLEATIMLAYKRSYNLPLGNMLFRTLNYIEHDFYPSLNSSFNFLLLQQNIDGYFGNYMKKEFSLVDIDNILNISFDSIQTILEKEFPDFRLTYEIQKNINIL